MKLAFVFLIVSIVACILVNLGAFIAEKIQKSKMSKMFNDIKDA